MKIRVGYIGITCEAPIFCAVENGFFKEGGLDVELVKCDWSKYKDVLASNAEAVYHTPPALLSRWLLARYLFAKAGHMSPNRNVSCSRASEESGMLPTYTYPDCGV